jgi:23S rRNA (cytidine1920-2'-O)/16S rRNA (cytidine1409-2'-O)-methyltransferase
MTRLDIALSDKGLCKSRSHAKDAILKGNVLVNDRAVQQPSYEINDNDNIKVINPDNYVGRGAYKLLQAFDDFNIDVSDKVVMDIGASTGGFTQVLLEKGVKKAYAIDVGHDQLDPIIKNDARVVVMEGTDIRNLKPSDIPDVIGFITCDVSFISLKKIAKEIAGFMYVGSKALFLIKPQFEAGRENIDKNGIVKNSEIRMKSVKSTEAFINGQGIRTLGLRECLTRGKEGNIEFLLYAEKS